MANVHGILAIIAAALAALTALVIIEGAIFLPAAFALGAGAYVAISQKGEMPILATSAAAALAGLLSVVALVVGAGGFALMAAPLAITGCLLFVGTALARHWDDIGSTGSLIVSSVLAIGAILSFVLNADLAIQTSWQPYLVAVPALVGLYPGIVAVKY